MLEVCIDDIYGLDVCQNTGVQRVELCSALFVGGLTPSAGLISVAAASPISVRVLIRPRAGDFNFNKREIALMCDDISSAVDAGVDGVVIGVANQHGTLNVVALRQMCKAAGSVSKTLHRVIDSIENPFEAMEQAIDLGFDTILSSGGAPCVENGIELLAQLNKQANGRIVIMAGAGLTPTMVVPVYQQTGISAFHSSCSYRRPANKKTAMLGFSPANTQHTDAELISQYHLALQAITNK